MKRADAIASGRPFRRKAWLWTDCWLRVDSTGEELNKYRLDEKIYHSFALRVSDLDAEDYEVYEKKVLLTAGQLLDAMYAVKISVRDLVGYSEISVYEYLARTVLTAEQSPVYRLIDRLGLGDR